MKPQDNQGTEAYWPSWAKEKEIGAWGFIGEEDNSQEDGKRKWLVSKFGYAMQISFW